MRTTKTITFPPSSSSVEKRVFLEFINDEINEKAEGYFAIIYLDESASDPNDVANFGFIKNGVTLLVIKDDDRK